MSVGDEPPLDLLSSTAAGPAAVRGGALRAGGYLAGAALSALSAAVLFRHLGVVDTGRYGLILSLVAIVGGLSDLGLTAIGVREVTARPASEARRFLQELLGLRIVLTVVGVALVLAFSVVAGYAPVVVAGVAIAGVTLLFAGLQSALGIPLQTSLRLGALTAAELIRQLISVGLIIALVSAGGGLLAAVAVGVPAGLVALVLTAWLVRHLTSLVPRFAPAAWRALVRSVLPYSLAVLATVLYFRLAIVAVSLLASPDDLGYFNASFRVVEVLVALPGLFVGAALPIFVRAAHEDDVRLRYGVARVFDVSLVGGVWVAVVLAVAGKVAIDVIGGPSFAPAATLLAIQGVAVAAAFVGTVWGNVLLSLDRQRDILKITLSALGCGLVLTPALVAIDGARGGAIATAVVEVLLALLGAYFVHHARPGLLPPMGVVAKVALAAALACLPAVLTDLPPLVLGVIATIIYTIVVLALRAVPAEVLDVVRRRVSR
ncbi:oligosaccharide flippase family protein [Solirubrobacter ginsenosidimutans]|uniref:Oligosaccharide flippase family protein n=1 Tax=Solirubrobacter ginsenosidimutans TaxID=490573 RepID=A0A9X3MXT0_9ACTN|nr:oligosaccharide flippase family protein [Solirubrobacter ginsenosidimutans]MDA0164719.1 oligosaccharide flippase family protein [Solirubrobacter ginsenosidimutans]